MSIKIPLPQMLKGKDVSKEELQKILNEIRRAFLKVQEELNNLDKKKQDKP